MRALSRLLLAALAGSVLPALAAPSIPLQSGAPQTFSIPVGSFINSYYFDVPEGTNRLAVTIEGTTPTNADVDLLLRYGTPFPDTTDGTTPPDSDYLLDFAQYHSVSQFGTESLVIDKATVFPVRSGRWFIALVSFDRAATAQIRATASADTTNDATITPVFDDAGSSGSPCGVAGWNDPTPVNPVGGNPGTTLGEQRRNAVLEATRLLSAQIRSPVPLRVIACWQNLGGDATSATLAQAGPRDTIGPADEFSPNKYLPRPQTTYSVSTATRLGGTNYCGLKPTSTQTDSNYCARGEIRATFNLQVDTPQVLGSRGFYYGLTPSTTPTQDSDFVSVAMHEMTHGLGFLSFVEVAGDDGVPVGAKADGYDDIYSANVVQVAEGTNGVRRFTDLTDAEREQTMTSVTGLRWDDPITINSPANPQAAQPSPGNFVKLYAPAAISPGSTLSHVDLSYPSTEIMRPTAAGAQRTLGLAQPMLEYIGWSNAARTPKSDALPPSGIFYDTARPGHGISFSRVAGNVYFMILYTYDNTGAPEWYIAIGPVVDGVFTPGPNSFGADLVRYRYVPNGNPKQQPDGSSVGTVRLDFNDARLSPACAGDTHDKSGALAEMRFKIAADGDLLAASDTLRWCMQPLVAASSATTPDFSGTWYAGNDDAGWGFSLQSFKVGANNALFAVLYYPDANGAGRWAFALPTNFQNGVVSNLVERHGYCRTCPVPASVQAGTFDDRPAGTIQFTLNGATQNQATGSTIYSINYQLPPNGAFARNPAPMVLLSVPPGQ